MNTKRQIFRLSVGGFIAWLSIVILLPDTKYPQLLPNQQLLCSSEGRCEVILKPKPIPVIRQSLLTGNQSNE